MWAWRGMRKAAAILLVLLTTGVSFASSAQEAQHPRAGYDPRRSDDLRREDGRRPEEEPVTRAREVGKERDLSRDPPADNQDLAALERESKQRQTAPIDRAIDDSTRAEIEKLERKEGKTEAGREAQDKAATADVDRSRPESYTDRDLTAEDVGILKDAAKGKGNFGLEGTVRESQAYRLGEAWVGPDHVVSENGKAWISKDGLRQFRPPTEKSNSFTTTGAQANFESRSSEQGKWQNNGHLDVRR